MLVSLADMKTRLNVSGSTYDTFLTEQITMVSEVVESYCRRKFESTEWVETFYIEDFQEFQKSKEEITCYMFPIISVDTVLEKIDEDDTGTAITDYRIHKPTAKIIKKRGAYPFFCGKNIVEITYTAGYATIPTPVQEVVYSVVGERYNKKVAGVDLNFGANVQSISIPGTISVAFDYSLDSNNRNSAFGTILGSNANVLDLYRSERAVVGTLRLAYVEPSV